MAMDRPWPWTVHGHGPSGHGLARPDPAGLAGPARPRRRAVYYTSLPRQYYTSLPRRLLYKLTTPILYKLTAPILYKLTVPILYKLTAPTLYKLTAPMTKQNTAPTLWVSPAPPSNINTATKQERDATKKVGNRRRSSEIVGNCWKSLKIQKIFEKATCSWFFTACGVGLLTI